MSKLFLTAALVAVSGLGAARIAQACGCDCHCGCAPAAYTPMTPTPEAAPMPPAPTPPQAANTPAPDATAQAPQTYRSFSAEPAPSAPRMYYGARRTSPITGWGLPKADPRKYSAR